MIDTGSFAVTCDNGAVNFTFSRGWAKITVMIDEQQNVHLDDDERATDFCTDLL
jgi:hypothetical protein